MIGLDSNIHSVFIPSAGALASAEWRHSPSTGVVLDAACIRYIQSVKFRTKNTYFTAAIEYPRFT